MTMRCTESHSLFNDKGFPRVLAAGDVVDDKDPAVKLNPDKFEPVEAHIARAQRGGVEFAVAEPGGEPREVTKPAKVRSSRTGRAPRKPAAKKAAAKKAPKAGKA